VQTLLAETDSPLLWVGRKLRGLASKRPSVMVQIYGEAGIGKTRAVTELLQATPFASVSKRAVTSIPELIGSLPKPKKVSSWLSAQLERLEDNVQAIPVLAAYLESLAPFVLHIEDLHECNEARVEIWQALIGGLKNSKGVGLLLTSRTKLEMPIESIHLEPLNLEASTALLEKEVGTVLPKEANAWIYAKAAGNPLFTLEYFRHLARQGFLWNDLTRWQWREPDKEHSMPAIVEALIEQHFLFLSQTTLHSIQVLSLLNTYLTNINNDVWQALTNLSNHDFLTTVHEAEKRRIVLQNAFIHPLIRELTFKSITSEQKSLLARQALELFPLEIGEVFIEHANLPAAQTVQLLQNAAEISPVAKQGFLLARAVGFASSNGKYDLALRSANLLRLQDVVLATHMARIAVQIQADVVALELLALLLASQGFKQEARATMQLGNANQNQVDAAFIRVLYEAQEFADVVDLWQNSGVARDTNDFLTMLAVAGSFVALGHHLESVLVIERTENLAVQPSDWLRIQKLKATQLFYQGKIQQSYALNISLLDQSRLIDPSQELAELLNNIAMNSHCEIEDAILYLEESIKIYQTVGNQKRAIDAKLALGNLYFQINRLTEAEHVWLESHEILRFMELSQNKIDNNYFLCKLYLEKRIFSQKILALKYGENAIKLSRESKNTRKLVFSLYYTALVYFWDQKIDQALQYALESLEIAQQLGNEFLCVIAESAKGIVLSTTQPQESAVVLERCMNKTLEFGVTNEAHRMGLYLDLLQNDLDSAKKRLIWSQENASSLVNLALELFPNLQQTTKTPEITFRLEVLGSMQISQNGVTSTVKGQKRKELLAALLEARVFGRTEVKTLELLDALYPNSLEEEGISALKQNVFKTRAAHGTSIIATTTNGYALGAISSDAEEFLKQGDTKLWRGAFLDGLSASEEVHETVTQACQNQAQKILETNPKEAARVMRLLLESEPYNLETLKLTCQALRNDNNHRTLQRLFTESRAKLMEVGEILPETWQEFLG
jgi:tetratricopeptide (TPR) repeat protein